MRPLAITFAVLVAFYVCACAFMALRQRAFLYFPDTTAVSAAAAGFSAAADVTITTADGQRLAGWWVAPAHPDTPVFLYFHGNGGHLADRAARFSTLVVYGAGLLAIDYRGYGGSSGRPTEAGLHLDAAAAFEELARRVDPGRIVVFGESLGTGLALKIAAERKVGAVVLDAPYVSVLDRAAAHYPWLPVRFLLRDTFRSDQWITKVSAPILAVHGTQDEIIPVADGERLMALATAPKRFIRVPGAGHGIVFREGAAEEVRRFLNELAGFTWHRR